MHSESAVGVCARIMLFSQWNGSMWCTPPNGKDKKKETIKYQGLWQGAFRSCDCWWLTWDRKLLGRVLLSCYFKSKHFWFLYLVLKLKYLGSYSVADPYRTILDALLVQFSSFPCSFEEIRGLCPLWAWHPRGSGKSWITGKEIIVSSCLSLQLKYSGITIRKK